MGASIERLKTPPPALKPGTEQLLTPPPTGGLQDHSGFAEECQESPLIKCFGQSEGFEEPHVAAYIEIQHSPDDSQEISTSVKANEKSAGGPPTETPTTSVPDSPLSQDKTLTCVSEISEANPIIEAFPFMQLPLVIRKKIYDILLVIPAIISVRQKHTSFHVKKNAYLYAERRELLPGISCALAQLTTGGHKFRYACFQSTNVGILLVSKEVHTEAKEVMYSGNVFDIVAPSSEMSPPADFKIHMFPRGYQRLVRKLVIRLRSFYPLKWLVNGGHAELKNGYRGLETLTLIFEIEDAFRYYGNAFARIHGEKWVAYVQRIHGVVSRSLFGRGKVKNIPLWIDLRILFDGERYDEISDLNDNGKVDVVAEAETTKQDLRRTELRNGLAEAFELFKKGGRQS